MCYAARRNVAFGLDDQCYLSVDSQMLSSTRTLMRCTMHMQISLGVPVWSGHPERNTALLTTDFLPNQLLLWVIVRVEFECK